jgi:3',5'-nucleoside bisphosphate phosphatase
MTFRADLHCHTICSDGTLTPIELIQLAVKEGLQGLSITDHDTVEAYDVAFDEALKQGIKIVPGVEFSAEWSRGNVKEQVHILAYSFQVDHVDLHSFCAQHVQRRLKRNRAILEQLCSQGLNISEEELIASVSSSSAPHKRVYGRPHIARILVEKGYAKSIADVFHQWIGEGKSCYVAGDNFSVQETITLIHRIGGLAVIAHPHLIRRQKVVQSLLEMDFDGIEGNYANFPADIQRKWITLGKERKWLITGGSDFHGAAKPNIRLGCSWTTEEVFHQLHQHYQKMAWFK